VTGPARGRWRIGRHFGPEAVEIALADLSEEERARLEADPALTIEIVGGARRQRRPDGRPGAEQPAGRPCIPCSRPGPAGTSERTAAMTHPATLTRPAADRETVAAVRAAGQAFLDLLEDMPQGREIWRARTKIEEAVMWAVKGIES
jgi:hypothetical protein